jgi:hypothetical protein
MKLEERIKRDWQRLAEYKPLLEKLEQHPAKAEKEKRDLLAQAIRDREAHLEMMERYRAAKQWRTRNHAKLSEEFPEELAIFDELDVASESDDEFGEKLDRCLQDGTLSSEDYDQFSAANRQEVETRLKKLEERFQRLKEKTRTGTDDPGDQIRIVDNLS